MKNNKFLLKQDLFSIAFHHRGANSSLTTLLFAPAKRWFAPAKRWFGATK